MKNSKKLRLGHKNQTGTSLIEVLISVLILGIGLLGIASMQAITLRNGQSSMERGQAVMQTYSIIDAMRSNVLLARANAYGMARTCTVPAAVATLAQNDLNAWMTNLQTNLGSAACGTIDCTTVANVCEITVEWNDSRGTSGSSAQKTVTRSRI
jgi:type IV pilus assembly protein PilV